MPKEGAASTVPLAVLFGGLDELHGSLAVHRLLLLGAAARAAAGGEDYGVAAFDRVGDLSFEVGDDGLPAELL